MRQEASESGTQEDYRRYIEVIVDINNPKSKATHNGIRYTFGQMMPRDVKPTHIRRYMDYWNSPRTVTLSSESSTTCTSPVAAYRTCVYR